MSASPLPTTVADLLRAGRTRLPDPREAILLVAAALDVPRERLYAHPERRVTPAAAQTVRALLERRLAGEPVAYLTGRREFFGLEFAVTPDVLIPRPETELVVELALARLAATRAPCVADLGTGCGAIAVAIAHARPDARVVALDRSAAALALARANAARHAADHVACVQGEWVAALAPQQLDLVVSNPPYVAAADPHLRQGDLRFEPRAALTAGADGLDAVRVIAATTGSQLRSGGGLVLEHGADQQQAVMDLLAARQFIEIEGYRDLAGLPRVVTALRA